MKTVEERFWSKVDKNGPVVKPALGPCWIWKAAKNSSGYGEFTFNGKQQSVHRIVWQLTHGSIPEGLCILHHCDNPPCVRPDHLFRGTIADNNHDAMAKGRNNCLPPHFSGENHYRARLTTNQVKEIREKRKAMGISFRKLAIQYNVGVTTIRHIIHGETWKENL
jgi:hypothetical protein